MINKAFDTITARVFKALEPNGYKTEKVKSASDNELVKLFTNEDTAYSVVYYKDKMHMVLRTCPLSEISAGDQWKTISTWMFDPNENNEKDINSIANDFSETLSQSKSAPKPYRKKKSGDDGNGDIVFFCKRLIVLFPELKEEIKAEQMTGKPFRCVNFAETKLVPRINDLLDKKNKADIKKLADILSAQYSYGDIDVRSVITIVILNSINNEEKEELLWEHCSPYLQKCWRGAKKFKGKKVKPEKPKSQKKSFIADNLTKA